MKFVEVIKVKKLKVLQRLFVASGLVVGLTFFMLGSNLHAEPKNLEVYFTPPQKPTRLEKLVTFPGEPTRLEIKAAANSSVRSISGKIYIPINHLSIIKIDPSFDFCRVWDQEPNYNQGYIEFVCAKNPETTLGKLMQITVVGNNNFAETEINFEQVLYADQDSIIQEVGQKSKLLLDNIEKSNVLGTQSEEPEKISDENAASIVFINVILLLAIAASVILAIRYYKLTQDEDN